MEQKTEALEPLNQPPAYYDDSRQAPATTDDPTERSFCSVAIPTVVYCGVPKRAEFDSLPGPATDHGLKDVYGASLRDRVQRRLLTKVVEQAGFMVVFQYYGLPA